MEPQALGYAAPSTPDQYLTADDYKNAFSGPGPSPFANGQVVVHNGQNYVRIQSGHDQYGNPTYAMAPYGSVNPGTAAPGAAGAPGSAGAPGPGVLSPSNPNGLTDPALIAQLAQGIGPNKVSVNPYGPTPGALAGPNFGGSAAPGSPIGDYMALMQARQAQQQRAPMVPGIGGGSAMPVHNPAAFASMMAGLRPANPAPMAAAPAAPGK